MIGFYLHHHGSGHRTRGTLIARHVVARSPVVGLGTGPRPRSWPGEWVELATDDDPIPGPLDDPTCRSVLHWAPLRHDGFRSRQAQIATVLLERDVRVMHVDVSVEVTLLARLLGVAVSIGAMPGRRDDRPHRMAYDAASLLIAPWPRGAHREPWQQHRRDDCVYVGGISRFTELAPELAPTETPTRSRRVLLLGGSGGSDVSQADLRAAAAATPGWQWQAAGGSAPASGDLWADLLAADVVVTHAGQNAVADVAQARRPAIVIAHRRPHDEQVATARALDRLGIATGLDGWPTPERWPALLDAALARGSSSWSRWLGGGAEQAATALLALLEQHRRPASRPPRPVAPVSGSAA